MLYICDMKDFEINTVIAGNCVDVMREMPEECVDMCITSPPYDNLRKYNGFVFPFDEIVEGLYRVIKPGGIVVWVVGDSTINGSETCTSFKQALKFVDAGFNLNDTMIWVKTNPMPQVKQPRYSSCFEYMFVFAKGKPKTFNPIMRTTKCGGQSYDSTCKNIGGENGRTEKHFLINKEAVDYNVWPIAIAQNKTGHPAVFPEELAVRHIKTWSNENDIVLDPMCGSGTSLIAARKLGRRYIGIDISEEYCKISEERLKEF